MSHAACWRRRYQVERLIPASRHGSLRARRARASAIRRYSRGAALLLFRKALLLATFGRPLFDRLVDGADGAQVEPFADLGGDPQARGDGIGLEAAGMCFDVGDPRGALVGWKTVGPRPRP